MEPSKTPRLPRAAKENSTTRGAYNAASILPKTKTGGNASSLSGTSVTVVSPSKTDSSPKKNAKGKGKAVGSDVDLDDDEEGRVAPSRRPSSARQEIIAKDPKYFRKQQAAKAKADLQATLRADDATDATETEPETKTKPARKPASQPPAMNKSTTTSKLPTAKTPRPAASRSTKAATIQKGNITKPTKGKKQPEESKRKHRKVDYDYDSVPDESDEEAGKSKTIAKLRETIDRHARWCPFVLLNKKLHKVHRRVNLLETSDSDEDNVIAEPEEDGDEDAVPEVDQSDAESDDIEDVQPSKKTQSKPNAKKVVPKQTALKKGKAAVEAASSKEVAFDLSNEQDETPGGMQSNGDSETEANQPESEDGTDMAAVPAVITLDSDGELSSLDESKVEQLQEAHEHEQQDLNKQADDSAPGRDASKQKGKRVDVEAGEGTEGPTKKQRRLS